MRTVPLPIDPHLPAIVAALARTPRVVLSAEPGAGKTTRIPPALLDPRTTPAGSLIVVLEPRRIAARLAAHRVATERGGRVGDEIGYQVRFERRASSATRILYVTDGVLLRWLLRDPYLAEVGTVVLDEFHERSLEGDLCLALLREVQVTVRPELRLVVMSATLEIEPLLAYLAPAERIEVPGRTYPIEIDYLEADPAPPLEESVRAAFAHWQEDGAGGSVLVFVPGASEIRRCIRALDPTARRAGFDLFPLHGDLPIEEQERAIRPGEAPRILVSTNVAEASITAEGVTAVIDSGRARVARFDVASGVDRLRTERISRASAIQRAGRAGRLGPGRCIRLYSEREFESMAPALEPEVERVDLASAVLSLRAWGDRELRSFAWLTPPPEEALAHAEELLVMLGAVEAGNGAGRITPLGRRLVEYPVAPRYARVLAEAEATGVAEPAALLVAIAEAGDPRRETRSFSDVPAGPTHTAESDLLVLADLFTEAARDRFSRSTFDRLLLDGRTVFRIAQTRDQLLRIVQRADRRHAPRPRDPRDPGLRGSSWSTDDLLLRAILAGHPDRVVRRHGPGQNTGVMVSGVGIELVRSSTVRAHPYFIALDAVRMADAGQRIRVHLASGIEVDWLEELFPGSVITEDRVRFDERTLRVAAGRATRYRGLTLREHETGDVDPAEGARVLAEAALRNPERALDLDRDAEDWLARVGTLRRYAPELSIPDPRSELLPSAIESLCTGRRSFDELRRAPLLPALQAALPPELRPAMERMVPARIRLPSGRDARIDYRAEQPVLGARLQEFFGLTETPRLAGGRIPLVLHLLAPSQRPLQVTQDLASFWKNVYPSVRGELRRRYPKHAWPDDPLTAKPQARPGR